MKNKIKRANKTTALVISNIDLTPSQKKVVYMPTPSQFIKQRKIRGGGMANYVEAGYVIARLNEAFSPVGWDFEILEQIIEPKEVVVKGKLTIKDYKTGYSVSKTQYGTKERYAGVPLGDTLKACASDCLKKCASLLGVALDVYWPQLDDNKKEVEPKKPKVVSGEQIYKMSVEKIKQEDNEVILTEWKNRIMTSSMEQKYRIALIQLINQKLGIKDGKKMEKKNEKE